MSTTFDRISGAVLKVCTIADRYVQMTQGPQRPYKGKGDKGDGKGKGKGKKRGPRVEQPDLTLHFEELLVLFVFAAMCRRSLIFVDNYI